MTDPITADERDKRGFGCYMEGKWLVDILLPGFIHAHSGFQFGEPTLIGSRLPAFVGLGWVWQLLEDRPDEFPSDDTPYTREQVIALAAFQAGVEWQRSRKRRKRIDQAVKTGWDAYWEEEKHGLDESTPGGGGGEDDGGGWQAPVGEDADHRSPDGGVVPRGQGSPGTAGDGSAAGRGRGRTATREQGRGVRG